MRISSIWRLAALLLLLAGAVAGPARPATIEAGSAAAAQDDDSAEDAREEAEERREDAAEEREEAEEERQEAAEERLEDEEDRLEEEREAAEDQVESVAAYTVEVDCVAVDDASTACALTGVAPEGGKKVASLVVPDDALCAGVVESDGNRVDPDKQSNVTGYKSRGKDGTLTLVFEGVVTTGGTATYWLKMANDIVPATGPGFVCDDPAAETPAPVATLATLEDLTVDIPASTPPATLEPTQESAPASTGTVTVSAYACPEGSAAASDYDWYGACDAGGDHRYALAPIGDDDAGLHAADTAKTGAATFADLPPGRYDLDDIDGAWCHAESDAVNADGDVVVQAGVDTTVWLFYCQPAAT